MKEYNIKLSEEKLNRASTGEKASEIDLVLQVWQDLGRLSESSFIQPEDVLIRNILAQILEKEYGKVEDIPVPDYYTYHERHKDDLGLS